MRDFALRRSPFLAPHPSPIRQSLGNPATVGGRSLPLLRIGSLCAKKAGRIGQLWPMCRALVQIANRGQNLFFSWLSSSPIAIPAHALPFLVRGVGKLGPPLSAGPSGTVLGTSCGGLKSHFFGPNCKFRFIHVPRGAPSSRRVLHSADPSAAGPAAVRRRPPRRPPPRSAWRPPSPPASAEIRLGPPLVRRPVRGWRPRSVRRVRGRVRRPWASAGRPWILGGRPPPVRHFQ